MFHDIPQLFVSGNVHADLVRAGEPRLQRSSARRAAQLSAEAAPARRRLPLLGRVSRPALS